jgi:hypothetical protein
VFRFQCFTQERIFSDPIYQGLFEALMAQGKTKEEALEEVTRELKWKIVSPPNIQSEPITIPFPAPNTIPYPYQPAVAPNSNPLIIYSGTYDSVSVNDKNGDCIVTYTMHDGKEVSWNAEKLRICLQGLRDSANLGGSGEAEVHRP